VPQQFSQPADSFRANSDRTQRSKKSLLNRLVGARERRWRHVEAERFGGLEVDSH
jgi:hypothetical protein